MIYVIDFVSVFLNPVGGQVEAVTFDSTAICKRQGITPDAPFGDRRPEGQKVLDLPLYPAQ